MACENTQPVAPPELFVLRDERGPILYAPLGRLMARANEPAVAAAVAYAADPTSIDRMTEDERAVVETFRERGFFERRAYPHHEVGFRPVQVTLFPTNNCNLRCSYCYAFGGEGGGNGEPITTMRLEVAQRAIDLIARNAKERMEAGEPIRNFLVSIHGNGEPFCAFDLIREIVWYGQDVAERLEVPAVFNAATNGVLSEEQLDFVVANFHSVNISFDGLPAYQDANRPLAGGGGSFARVDRIMSRLVEAGVDFGIRTTVTAAMVERMSDIVEFVADRYPGIEQLHFEPVWECGRCKTSADTMPSSEDFTRSYLAALEVAHERGVRLVFSGARQDMLVDTFCKVSSGSFTVTPTGDVTACYEVSYASDPRSERFFFGHFDQAVGDFVFDQGKLDELSRLCVHNIRFCDDCFCRWHCAGDCAAKVLDGIALEEHHGSVRCQISRALTLNQIQRKLDWKPTDDGRSPDGR
ncbi:MAG: hypothetical protein IJH08_07085 [Atopobiaceae bacterium]|nr:hypothetical protein [Atopobiaceae bacterium]